MIFDAMKFVFEPPPVVARARRVLIKPNAAYPLPYPVTTSRETLAAIIEGIRQVSDADIVLLEGTPGGGSVHPIYHALGYDFPRVLMLDVKDSIWVEVENPLAHPFAISTFWVPNVVLSSDYLITIAPLKVFGNSGGLSIENLLSLLPVEKYRRESSAGWGELYSLGIHRVIADLYFTLPFDLGVIDARKKLISVDDPTKGEVEEYGKVFIGEPYGVDREASEACGLVTEHLRLIEMAKMELAS